MLEQLEGTLLDWVFGPSQVLRQRAMTAFASLPAERLAFLQGVVSRIIDERRRDPGVGGDLLSIQRLEVDELIIRKRA